MRNAPQKTTQAKVMSLENFILKALFNLQAVTPKRFAYHQGFLIAFIILFRGLGMFGYILSLLTPVRLVYCTCTFSFKLLLPSSFQSGKFHPGSCNHTAFSLYFFLSFFQPLLMFSLLFPILL